MVRPAATRAILVGVLMIMLAAHKNVTAQAPPPPYDPSDLGPDGTVTRRGSEICPNTHPSECDTFNSETCDWDAIGTCQQCYEEALQAGACGNLGGTLYSPTESNGKCIDFGLGPTPNCWSTDGYDASGAHRGEYFNCGSNGWSPDSPTDFQIARWLPSPYCWYTPGVFSTPPPSSTNPPPPPSPDAAFQLVCHSALSLSIIAGIAVTFIAIFV